ncbi:MAG: helix-turn-helix domain-containing protein [Pseudomonadota bacterium]
MMTDKKAFSVNEMLATLPIGKTTLYKAIKSGKLRATKLGKKTLFLAKDVSDFLEALPSLKNGGENASR